MDLQTELREAAAVEDLMAYQEVHTAVQTAHTLTCFCSLHSFLLATAVIAVMHGSAHCQHESKITNIMSADAYVMNTTCF